MAFRQVKAPDIEDVWKSYLSCWLDEQIVNFSGSLLSSRETLAKDGGSEVNMDESLKENTEKHLAAVIAAFARQAALNRYIFTLKVFMR